jgi:glycosyltransferase involved in cell wall biosynthesis
MADGRQMTITLVPKQTARTGSPREGKPIRILHLCAGNLFGGVERVLTTIAQQRRSALGMEPVFGLCFPGRLRDDLEESGVEVINFGPVRLSRPWTVFRARRALRRSIRELEIDVVATHGFWSHAVFAPSIRRVGTPLAFYAHGPFGEQRWLDRLGSRSAPDVLLANSRFTADSFAGAFPGVRREVIGLPSPTAELNGDSRTTLRNAMGSSADAVVIVMASRIEPLKGHAVLLEALSRLKRKSNWKCWIVGGAQRPEEERLLESLKAKSREFGIDGRVRFLGSRCDVADVLRAADVYCQPNTLPEAFGLSFIEALDAGLPVVTSRLGGPQEFLDDSCAILTRPGDVQKVADALELLIEDPDLRRRLGGNGPARARSVCEPSERLAALQNALESVCKAVRWA